MRRDAPRRRAIIYRPRYHLPCIRRPPAPGAPRFVIVLGADVLPSGVRGGREASFAPTRPARDATEPSKTSPIRNGSPIRPKRGQYSRPFGRRPVPQPAKAVGRSARRDFPHIQAAQRAQGSLERTSLNRTFLRQVAGGRSGQGRAGPGRRLRFFNEDRTSEPLRGNYLPPGEILKLQSDPPPYLNMSLPRKKFIIPR